jgi:SNF family Na+-dependent transporter
VHIYVLVLLLAGAPLVPALAAIMDKVGSVVLLPLSALSIAVAVGWFMPQAAQRQILGRGPLLDGFFLLWRPCIRYLTPAFLIWTLLRQI